MRAVLALIVLLAFAVAPGRALDGRQFRLHGGRLVDERRREVTLRGVNARVEGVFDVTFGDGRLPLEPIPVFDDGDAATMARFGLNLLRLPISWSALEPVRGRFDAAYLDRIAAVVALCRAHGIVVLLDFHQDAFSKEIGEDGAARWVLDLLLGPNNYPYLGGPLTDLGARRRAPATLAAFRQFFLDAGGVQEDPRGGGGRARAPLRPRARGARLRDPAWKTEGEGVTVAAGSSVRSARAGDPSRRASSCIRPRPERWRSSRRSGRR